MIVTNVLLGVVIILLLAVFGKLQDIHNTVQVKLLDIDHKLTWNQKK